MMLRYLDPWGNSSVTYIGLGNHKYGHVGGRSYFGFGFGT